LLIAAKVVKRAGHGFRSFANYRQHPPARRRRELGGNPATNTPHQKPLTLLKPEGPPKAGFRRG
jgi:hypothetical protein